MMMLKDSLTNPFEVARNCRVSLHWWSRVLMSARRSLFLRTPASRRFDTGVCGLAFVSSNDFLRWRPLAARLDCLGWLRRKSVRDRGKWARS